MSVSELTRQQAVFDRLRQGILSGTLAAGSRLPPSRTLSEELGVSRQTIVLAYERLAAEGYVRPRPGSGTYVAPDLPDAAPMPAAPAAGAGRALSARGARLAALPVNAAPADGLTGSLLAGGIPAPELFPAQAWARCAAKVLKTAAPDLAGYPPPQGLLALRAQIAAYLAASRGLLVDPECVLVTAGTQQALRLAADLLLDPGDAVWVEDPGYIAGRGALLAAGATLVPVPSGPEGIDVAAGVAAARDARLALVAPSHSTPLGGALPVGQRLALLDWAARADAWVLEDDCDTEFRWSGKPLPPLASLDRSGRVIYCGSFSKCLAPALRLGFVAVPKPLLPAFVRLHTLADRGSGSFGQAVLAEFMAQGLLAPHVRRMRTEYANRRAVLLETLARHVPDMSVVPAPGGLHLTVLLPAGIDEAETVSACRARGLSVAPLAAYYVGPRLLSGLVLGFAATPAPLIPDAVRRLSAACRAEASSAAVDCRPHIRP
jgi:GntR family transcriptional regulator/MocR family aminotransferase